MVSTGLMQRMKGFTLIEIAIVLVVIGLLLSGGLLAVAPVLERTKITETENKIQLIEDSLVLYAIQNSCLPCPADAVTAGTAVAGEQADSSSNTLGAGVACADATACHAGIDGVVPWLTLGLTRADATDGWGTLINYHLSTSASSNATVPGTPACDDLQDSANDAGSGGFNRLQPSTYPQGCLDVEDQDPAGFNTVNVQAAYVLISHGPDTSGGFSADGGAARLNPRSPGNTVQEENNDGTCDDTGTQCHQGNQVVTEGNDQFDDIVVWKTGPSLVQQCGAGACGNP